MITAYEVRFFRVGEESKGGDAILIRLLDEYNRSSVIIVDGGYSETGEVILNYLRDNNVSTVDLVINTHPDVDHTAGLIRLFEEQSLSIKKLIMNRPWRDSNITADYFKDNRITDNSVNKRMTEAFKYAFQLEQAAIKKIGESNIIHPVVRNTYLGCLTILAPSKELYREKLLESDKTPTTLATAGERVFSMPMKKMVKYIRGFMPWYKEETSPINETSIVSLLCLPGRNFLLTADAGKNCLTEALRNLKTYYSLCKIDVLQLPHHGSRKNITPELVQQIGAREFIISCPRRGIESHHPSRRLINMIHEKIPGPRIFSTAPFTSFIYYDGISLQCTLADPIQPFEEIEDY